MNTIWLFSRAPPPRVCHCFVMTLYFSAMFIILTYLVCTQFSALPQRCDPTITTTITGGPHTDKGELLYAIAECLKVSTDCSKSPHGPIGSWNITTITDMHGLFDGLRVINAVSFNGDISKWDVSRVTNMHDMFSSASRFNSDISKWDVSRVTNMLGTFSCLNARPSSFNSDISKWDVSRVECMFATFAGASSFNGDLSKWDVSRVTNMRVMFAEASSFNGNVSKWDVARVTTMEAMFAYATSFNQTLAGAWLIPMKNKSRMFYGSSGQICSTIYTPNGKTIFTRILIPTLTNCHHYCPTTSTPRLACLS